MENKIVNGDCFDVLHTIPSKSVHAVICDPPYGETQCVWDQPVDLQKLWKQLKRIGKPNCMFIFFTSLRYGVKLINSNPGWFRYDLVYSKPNSVGFLKANKVPLRSHEMILVFANKNGGVKTYNPQKFPGKPYVHNGSIEKESIYEGQTKVHPHSNTTGDRFPTSVLAGFKLDKHKLHPTQKPVALCKWLVETYTNPGNMVLDCFMGSGSTVLACIQAGRQYIGIEKDTPIYATASMRIQTAQAESEQKLKQEAAAAQ